MSDALQNAALAFDKSMGNSNTSDNGGGGSSETSGKTETIFENFNTFGENSESSGGGDTLPDPKPKRAKRPVEDDDQDDDTDLGDVDLDEDDEDKDPEDDEDADDDGEDDDEGDDDDLGELANQEFEIMVDGEETKVTLKEALNGYIRTQTFHKKMNEVNEGRQAVAAAARDTVARRNAAIAKLTEAEETLTAIMPAEPDWDALFDAPNADHKAIRSMQKQFETLKGNIASVKKNREEAEAVAAEEARKEDAKYAKEEFGKFIEKNPKIRRQADLEKELKSMKRTALAIGFSEQEVLNVLDSRMLLVLQKASKYDRIMAHKPKPIVNGGKKGGNAPIRSRNVQGKTVQKDFDRANKRLTQTGSVEAAADVFQQILKRGR